MNPTAPGCVLGAYFAQVGAALRRLSRADRAVHGRELTPGRQRSYLYHFAAAKQSATRLKRIERAMPAIFAGRGFLERR